MSSKPNATKYSDSECECGGGVGHRCDHHRGGANEPEANKLFRMVMKHKGSDLHLKVGLPPCMRLGRRAPADGVAPLDHRRDGTLDVPAHDPSSQEDPRGGGGTDFAHIVYDGKLETRFRVNLFRARGGSAWSPDG